MLPDRVSNPGPLTYDSGVLPIALRGPARSAEVQGERRYENGNTTTAQQPRQVCK